MLGISEEAGAKSYIRALKKCKAILAATPGAQEGFGSMARSESEKYDLLDRLADEFAARFRRGERPALEEYTDRYPELAQEIRELFPAMVRVEQAECILQGEKDDVTGASPASNLPPLRQIGDYRILREVGRGGMGVVYEAEQVSLGRRVALKVLPGQVSSDRLVQERFRREARAAARLHHTNIVPVYEVGQDGDVRYYAMQFIEGQGLDAVITELRGLLDRARSQSRMEAAAEDRSHWHSREQRRQGALARTLGEGLEVSPVLRYILTGRFDPGGPSPELAGASQPMPARALAGGLATPTGTETEIRAAGSDAALTRTEAGTATAGDTTGPGQEHPPAPRCHRRPRRRQGRRSCPGVPSSRRSSRAGGRSSGAWRRLAGRLPRVWPTPMRGGIVHRDIKPSNLLLDNEGVVWIADFGLAKGEDEGLTQSGDILGTLRYMAPERFRGLADARADVYALGLTLYELLTLRSGIRLAGPAQIDRADQDRGAEEAAGPRCPHPARPGDDRLEGDREGPQGEVPVGRGDGRGPAAVPRRRADPGPPGQRRGALLAVGPAQSGDRGAGRGAHGLAGRDDRRARWWPQRTSGVLPEVNLAPTRSCGRPRKSPSRLSSRPLLERDHSRQQSADLTLDKGFALAQEGHADRGLLWMLEALKTAPDDAEAFRRTVRWNLGAWLGQVHKPLRIFDPGGPCNHLAFSPDGRSFATSYVPADRSNATPIDLWDTASGRKLSSFPGAFAPFAFRPDGKVLVAHADKRRRMVAIDLVTGRVLWTTSELPGESGRAISLQSRRFHGYCEPR